MTDDGPRFSRWFQRWWVALVGGVVAIGGGVIYEASEWTIPRGSVQYTSSPPADWAFVAGGVPAFLVLERVGLGLVMAGLVAVIATVVVRLVRRRRSSSAEA
ncbi:hypothetical protein GCM10022288_14640 [Gryllotalpicola kribbensis]|jgi:hypothetical protein|uniref:Uncharacterized protein n=1 Tax=Gryllotalpicola kribbensis TaxID=993084 RepID=A0ABP8AQW7_9MICO